MLRSWRENPTPFTYALWERAKEICEQFQSLKDAVAAADGTAGYKAAQKAQYDAKDRYEAAAKRLIPIPAATLDGVVAKARAYRLNFACDKEIAK